MTDTTTRLMDLMYRGWLDTTTAVLLFNVVMTVHTGDGNNVVLSVE